MRADRDCAAHAPLTCSDRRLSPGQGNGNSIVVVVIVLRMNLCKSWSTFFFYLILFAEVDGKVDCAVFSWWDGSGDPAGSVGRIVEIGQQTCRVTTTVFGRVADGRVVVARRRRTVVSPTTSTTPPSPPPAYLPRLDLTTHVPSA